MPPKRPVPSKVPGIEPKRSRNFKSLQEKVELLDLLHELKSYAAVARHYGINESTVRSIKKNESAIRNTVSVSFCNSAEKVTKGIEPKRHRNFKTLQEKVELLDLLRELKSYAAVARHYGINESTVRSIKKNEAAIRNTVSVSFCNSAKKVKKVRRNKNIVRMESVLALWIIDCKKKNIDLDGNVIRDKARNLYQHFAARSDVEGSNDLRPGSSTAPEPEEFVASKGWFHRFQKRFNISLQGETSDKEGDPDNGRITEENFNVDEADMLSKKMLSDTYIIDMAVRLTKILDDESFDVGQDEVNSLVDTHSEPLDFLELTMSVSEEEATEPDHEKEQDLTMERLLQIIRTAEELQGMVQAWDPCPIRTHKVSNSIDDVIQTYKTVLATMKK